jgi:hypothetical protein
MDAKGWEVTATDYHFEQEVYSWRHEIRGGNSPTLRIARYVLRSQELSRQPALTSHRSRVYLAGARQPAVCPSARPQHPR